MIFKIALVAGDGVGAEISEAAVTVLGAIGAKFSHTFEYSFPLIGGAAIDRTGVPLPQETIDECSQCDAILIGSVGGAKWIDPSGVNKAEKGLHSLRNKLGLFASISPFFYNDDMRSCSPLRHDLIKRGFDFLMVRELLGGIYYGSRGYADGLLGQQAFDTESYAIAEVERITKVAFDMARTRRKRVVSIDLASILESSRLWRTTVSKLAKTYTDIHLEHMLITDFIKEINSQPSQFDVVLCPNLFGEIAEQAAITIAGTPNMIPSSNVGLAKCGLFRPLRSDNAEWAGQNAANPIGMILCTALMLGALHGLNRESAMIERAVKAVLSKGFRTADVYAGSGKKISCSKMAETIALEILNS